MTDADTIIVSLSPRDYDAVLFDLDGVLTRTASIHAAAWKRLFDEFLQRHAASAGERFVPFDVESDYRQHVDGKPRQDGVTAFLASRGIVPAPDAGDGEARAQTVETLSRRKDAYFLEGLATQGVAVFAPAIALVKALRDQQVGTAVVSSSNNCAAVLKAAGIESLFDARVDGTVVTQLGLAGKPAPDAFLEAARRLGVDPSRAVVVEDAVAGVAAGRAGGFGSVIGVDRGGQAAALRAAGADVVVATLAQVGVSVEPPSAWTLVFDGFDPASEGIREALCTLGNGYFATRAAAVWSAADGTHYPGTYLAGGYNRLRTSIAGRVVENEDLVNFPNWLALTLRIGDTTPFDPQNVTLRAYRQELDLRRGLLVRDLRFEDRDGRRSRLTERRFVSMSDMHVGAVELTLTPENWSGDIGIQSGIDGRVVNAGARLYERFSNRHLDPVSSSRVADDIVALTMCTSQSGVRITQMARTRLYMGIPHESRRRLDPERRDSMGPAHAAEDITVGLAQGESLVLEKVVALHTSRDRASSACDVQARKTLDRAGRFEALLADHVLAWKHVWRRFDVHVQPTNDGYDVNVPMLLRLNMFHLLQTASLHTIDLDTGVPARGWTGEAYQGHVFWDELFIFPFLNHRVPEITRALLMYRYRRLDEARAGAAAAGHAGAMFPWQSGSDGQEETQEVNLNPRSHRWVTDNSYLQRHVGSAVAYNVWQYFQVTRDVEFLEFHGAELIIEIARFWSSIARFDPASGRYVISGVMGPDEFHDAYPDAQEAGLDNNAYTNLMAVWVLCRALDTLELLSELRRAELSALLGLSREEIERWDHISRRMHIPFHGDGIISQFEGYEGLKELDWPRYRSRYGNIQRLDLILEAEGDSANRYKASKQADVLMLFYLFSSDELDALFRRLDYAFDLGSIPKIVNYYAQRTTHGSTLCRVVHAWVLARSDRPRSMAFFVDALQSDVSDIQQGSTAEGIHLGAMAGTVDLVERVSTGIAVVGDTLKLDPELPPELERLDLRVRYRGHSLDLRLTRDTLTVRGRDRGIAPITLCVEGHDCAFEGGSTRTFRLKNHPQRKEAR